MSLRRILPGIVLSATLLACSSDPAPSTEPADTGTGADAVGDASPESCEDDEALCGGECVDTLTDDDNCGGCGRACPTEAFCSDAQCTCPAGLGICDEACIDLDADPVNCGECGNVCGSAELCDSGECVTDCAEERTECAGSCVDTTQNPRHCGGCDIQCPTDENQDAFCEAGVCGRICRDGFFDLDGEPGCEYACSGDPDAEEICDGIDNDCDGLIDDADDNYVAPLCERQLGVCGGAVAMCIDGEPAECNADDYNLVAEGFYSADLDACDAVDNDCDGLIDAEDETFDSAFCSLTAGACAGAVRPCVEGRSEDCQFEDYEAASSTVPYTERYDLYCDGEDNDCDTETDELCCDTTGGLGFDIAISRALAVDSDIRGAFVQPPYFIVADEEVFSISAESQQRTDFNYESRLVLRAHTYPTGSPRVVYDIEFPALVAVLGMDCWSPSATEVQCFISTLGDGVYEFNAVVEDWEGASLVPRESIELPSGNALSNGVRVDGIRDFGTSVDGRRFVAIATTRSGQPEWLIFRIDASGTSAQFSAGTNRIVDAVIANTDGAGGFSVLARDVSDSDCFVSWYDFSSSGFPIGDNVVGDCDSEQFSTAGFRIGGESFVSYSRAGTGRILSVEVPPSSDDFATTISGTGLASSRTSASGFTPDGREIAFADATPDQDQVERVLRVMVQNDDRTAFESVRDFRGDNVEIVGAVNAFLTTVYAVRVGETVELDGGGTALRQETFFFALSADGKPLCSR